MYTFLCRKCGLFNPPSSKFCQKCGGPVIDLWKRQLDIGFKGFVFLMIVSLIILTVVGIFLAIFFILDQL